MLRCITADKMGCQDMGKRRRKSCTTLQLYLFPLIFTALQQARMTDKRKLFGLFHCKVIQRALKVINWTVRFLFICTKHKSKLCTETADAVVWLDKLLSNTNGIMASPTGLYKHNRILA